MYTEAIKFCKLLLCLIETRAENLAIWLSTRSVCWYLDFCDLHLSSLHLAYPAANPH